MVMLRGSLAGERPRRFAEEVAMAREGREG